MIKSLDKESNYFKIIKNGEEEISEQFSNNLQNLIINKYSRASEEKAFENKLLGRIIITLLLFLFLHLLYLSLPILKKIPSISISLVAFLVCFWGGIFLFKSFYLKSFTKNTCN